MGEVETPEVEAQIVQAEPMALAPSESEFQVLMRTAKYAHGSGFFGDHIKNPQQAMTIALMARELGIGPMAAFRGGIYVVNGRPCLSAQMMMGLVRGRGLGKFAITSTADSVTVRAERTDTGDVHEVTWTLEQAKAAGLAGKDIWKKYLRQMLTNRAVAEVCRFLFPDVLSNLYTPEEVAEFGPQSPRAQEVRGEIDEVFSGPSEEPESSPEDGTDLKGLHLLIQHAGLRETLEKATHKAADRLWAAAPGDSIDALAGFIGRKTREELTNIPHVKGKTLDALCGVLGMEPTGIWPQEPPDAEEPPQE